MPVAPVVILPRDTVVASWITTAVAALLVVFSAPANEIVPSLPSSRIVPLPASTMTPTLIPMPEPAELPLRVMAPDVLVMLLVIVRPLAP